MKSFQRLFLPAITVITALSACQASYAQQVYRCGNSYSQIPCEGAIAINTDDPRTEAQRAEAKAGLTSDKALAKDLEANRRKDEATALAQQKAAQTSKDKKPAPAKLAEKTESKKKGKKAGDIRKVTVKNADTGFFTATDGATTKKKKVTPKSAAP